MTKRIFAQLLIGAAFVPLSLALQTTSSLASSFGLTQTLLNPIPESNDLFGSAIDISGNNIVVGAPLDDTAAVNSGAAYLFDATTGNLLQTFLAPDASSGDQFGEGVAIDGNNVLIGVRNEDTGATDSGAAYLFDATTGNLLQKFLNPFPEFESHFGESVAISGNYALIGAIDADRGVANSGAAYLFDIITGDLLHEFPNPTRDAGDAFGAVVAIDGDNVLVSAPRDDTGAPNSGATYLFDAVTGSLLRPFFNPTPAANEFFGFPAIDGDNVLIGARANDFGGDDSGAAYLFDTDGNLSQTFPNPTPAVDDFFGIATALDNNHVLIGAQNDDDGGIDSGAAHLFDIDGTLLQTFLNPTPADGDRFGRKVAIDGNFLIVSADEDDAGAMNSGAVYVYRRVSTPEPTTVFALLGIGAFAISTRRHKKK